jgi:hypothetical protein
MKKLFLAMMMLFVLSVFTFADGDLPTGNKSCPNGQTCRPASESETENPVIKAIKDFLKFIYG